MTLEELKQNYKDALLSDFVHAVNTRLSYEEYCALDGKTLDEKATKLYKQLHNMEKLEITKEAVLRAAQKCQTAKDILKEMFPQVFKKDKYFDLSKVKINIEGAPEGISSSFIGVCGGEEYANKGFYLSSLGKTLEWNLVKDRDNYYVLIPTRK